LLNFVSVTKKINIKTLKKKKFISRKGGGGKGTVCGLRAKNIWSAKEDFNAYTGYCASSMFITLMKA